MVRKKEFAVIVLDPENEIFVVYVVSFIISCDVYPSGRIQIVSLKINKDLITVFLEYFDFADVFSPELIAELPEYTKINNYAIGLINSK